MTRIDFHSNVHNKLLYACRLTRKAHATQHKIILHTKNSEEMTYLDKLLWTFSAKDFLPHVYNNNPLASNTPIILIDQNVPKLPHYQILINLSHTILEYFSRFERIFEIISTNEIDKIAGRKRYLFYRHRCYSLRHYLCKN